MSERKPKKKSFMEETAEKIPFFCTEVRSIFAFLEKDYQYQEVGEDCFHLYGLTVDALVIKRYIGSAFGVEIYWRLADQMIGIDWIELVQAGIFPEKRAFVIQKPEYARAINLYSLMRFLGKSQDPDLLLLRSDTCNSVTRRLSKNQKIIQTNITGVLEGLAHA